MPNLPPIFISANHHLCTQEWDYNNKTGVQSTESCILLSIQLFVDGGSCVKTWSFRDGEGFREKGNRLVRRNKFRTDEDRKKQ